MVVVVVVVVVVAAAAAAEIYFYSWALGEYMYGFPRKYRSFLIIHTCPRTVLKPIHDR